MSGRGAGVAAKVGAKGAGRVSLRSAPEGAHGGGSRADPASPDCAAGKASSLPINEQRDLFGFPVTVKPDRRGRPRHVPTAAARALVIELRDQGLLQPEIAEALGISQPTMVLNYPQELGSTSQAWRRRAELDLKGTVMADSPAPAWLAQARELMAASTTPMRGGAGRLTRVRAAIEVLHSLDRKLFLEALDEMSRPMTAREIDEALIATGLPRTDRKRLVKALKDFPIMLIARP